jgi:hypothetical protein
VGAREKLNGVHLLGAIAIAGILGALAESWLVFFIAAAVLVAVEIHAGNVRLEKRRR